MDDKNDVNKPLLPPKLPRWWRVLPFLILIVIISTIDALILNDFIEYRFTIEYQLNASSIQNARELCLNASRTSHNSTTSQSTTTTSKYSTTTTLSPDQRIQESNARLNVYISLAATIPAIIVAILLGANCDRVGRKLLIVLPFIGKIIRYFILTAVVYYDLSDTWIILSVMLDSIFGTAALNIISAFAYVTDCTDEKSRTVAIIITDVSINGSRFIPLITMGIYLQKPHFLSSMIITLLLSLVGFVGALVLQPESNLSVQHLNIFQQLKIVNFRSIPAAFRVFFVKREGHKQRSLLLLVTIHLTVNMMLCGQLAMYYIYLYGAPFCLDSFGVSLNNVAQSVAIILLTVPFTLNTFKHIDHLALPALGWLAFIAYLVLFGIATQVWMLYLAVCIDGLYFVLIPVIRSRITKLVEPSEYAMVFILAMIVESGGYFAISALTNEIYQVSISFLPGLVYFVIAIFGVIPITLMLILYILEYRSPLIQKNVTLNE